ncbi:MAG: glycosyltransferase family 39 protein, partial [Anaerolineaceae bacterium]|nr:glycosyltransferase family 39 protein [Anaerolineaceae bacterium]
FLRLNSPLMHDEAYSMAIWGRSDLFFAISDYHLPNNHVFHSVLVNLIYHHIGKTVPLLRLPVFISGCLLIPAVWLLGRLFYREVTGLIAAGFTAFAPFLVFYSHNARGYEIQAFLTVLTVGLVVYAKRKRNLFSWVLLILFSALNFFTLPIALYPFGGICVWLFLNVIFYKKNNIWRNRWQMLKYLVFMGISVSILSMLLYVPLLSVSGWDSFFGNIYIGGTEAATFGETMISRVKDNLQAFTESWPLFVNLFIGVGLILSLFSFRKNSKESLSFGLALFIWMGLLIPIQRPNLWPRTLLFLHPFFLLFASSGLSVLLKNKQMKYFAVCIYACLILTAGISQMTVISETGPDERAVKMIVEREGNNASNIHFVTAAQDNAPIWIYADAYNLPRKIFDKRESFNTIYAFVNPANDAYQGPLTLDDLMNRFGPGKNFIDWSSSEILMDEPNAILYRFEGKESAIRKAYGNYPIKQIEKK